MDKIHQAPYASHPGYQNTIATTRKQYFSLGMKRDMAEYISRCMKCQQVKIEHQHPAGLLQPLSVPEWKWEVVSMYFIIGFPMTLRQRVFNHAIEDELYVQVKDKLQQQIIDKRCEGYKLEEDGILTYKNRIYITQVADLRRIVMDEIHQGPYSGHSGYQKTIATARKQYFWPGMKKGYG